MTSIDRRSFLILALAVTLAGFSLLALPSCLSKTFARKEAEPAAGELAIVVEEYLDSFPRERDVGFLCESLELKVEDAADRSFLSKPRILVRIQQDFEEGRIVSLAGWILSRTEARVLTLVSLLEQRN